MRVYNWNNREKLKTAIFAFRINSEQWIILTSVAHPFFRIKMGIKRQKRKNVKTLFLMEIKKLKQNENNHKNSNTKKKRITFYVPKRFIRFIIHKRDNRRFRSPSTFTRLRYITFNIKMLSNSQKIFFKFNICLLSSVFAECLFSYGSLIMRLHTRKTRDFHFKKSFRKYLFCISYFKWVSKSTLHFLFQMSLDTHFAHFWKIQYNKYF